MIKDKPELLSPAGNWPSLIAAVESGADSVYFGVKNINMRHLASNFDVLEIKKVMEFLHKNNKRGYLALNTIIMNGEIAGVKGVLRKAKDAGADAVIFWDMAVFAIAKELGLPVHLSTQASVSNIEALKIFNRMGIKRVILARECTLVDIKQIIHGIEKEGICCEVEAFIHGAMCISISGRCLLSHYSHGKSANKGECIQPCRREFFIKDTEGETEFILGKDYLLSPKDLCTIDFIEELINAGISSFKIEGRMRPPEYVRVVTSVYRQAIDSFFEGGLCESLKERLKQRLTEVYNRGFSGGFYFGRPGNEKSRGGEHSFEKIYLGEVTRFFKKINVAEIRIKNKSLRSGDQILFIGKTTPANFITVDEMQSDNVFVDKVNKGDAVGVKLFFKVRPRDKVFLWRKK